MPLLAHRLHEASGVYDDPDIAEFDRSLQGQFDFHNGVYYPSLAYLDGISPYGQSFAERYPVTRPLPLMSPLVLLVHAPLAMMPVRAAEVVYLPHQLRIDGIAGLVLRALDAAYPYLRTNWWLIAGLLIVASRAGHTTLFTAI